ncbi:MAG TPA: amino acid ABC transporter permease [Rhizomicrobium sp.]|nr:amino acid ABC transporter permease [Rhizomicrobium sp.]
MERISRHTPREVAGESGSARRLNIGGIPTAPTAMFLVVLSIVVVVEAGSLYTIRELWAALRLAGFESWFVAGASALLALASVLIALPLTSAFMRWRDVRRAIARNDVVAARIARSDALNRCWITLGYIFAQFIAALACQFLLANNQAVAKTFFLVPLMVESFPLVLKAFWVNVEIFTVTEILVLIWGLIVALAMLAPGTAGKPLRVIAATYVDVFRAIPAVLVIYLVGFGVPLTGVPILKDFSLTAFVIIALTLTVGAYVAEIYRAGIQSIHWSQAAAARSLGLSHLQTLRFVIVPQGVRQIIPPLLNAFIALQKDTALVSVVGVIDSFNQSMLIATNHYNLSAVTTVAVLFIAISIPQSRFVERMMQRDRARLRGVVV